MESPAMGLGSRAPVGPTRRAVGSWSPFRGRAMTDPSPATPGNGGGARHWPDQPRNRRRPMKVGNRPPQTAATASAIPAWVQRP